MTPSPVHSDNDKQLFDRAAELAAAERRPEILARYPELRQRSVVEQLVAESNRLILVDVQRAEELAVAAGILAEALGDDLLRARSRRTRGNVLHVRGDQEGALQLYEQALELFRSRGDELEAGITQSTALHALSFAGRHERALEWAAEARRLFVRLGDRLRLARLDLNMGVIIARQERFQDGREHLESAYEELLQIGSPQDVALCLRNLATLYIGMRDFERAEETYNRARDYSVKEDLPLLLAEIDYNIAYLYYLRGEYTTALRLYGQTRDRCEQSGDDYHSALCDMDETEIFLELNLIEEALRSSDHAFKSFERLGMRYEQAKTLFYLAVGRIRQGKTVLGLELFDKAREIFVAEKNRVWPALIDLCKALALAAEGRRFEATQLASQAFEVFSALSLRSKMAICETLLARLTMEADELGRARNLCQSALRLLGRFDMPALEYQAYFVLGQIEEAAGRPDRALQAYVSAHARLERQRSKIRVDELKIPLVADKLQVYESLVSLIVDGRAGVADREVAFEYAEKAKARNLADMVAFRGLALPAHSSARSAQVERVRRLREELNWYYRRIDLEEMAQEERSLRQLEELHAESRRTEDKLAQTLRDLEGSEREFSSLQNAATASLDEIRSVLPADALLLEYFCARGTIYAFVIDQKGLEIVPVSLVARVSQLQHQFQGHTSKLPPGGAPARRGQEASLRLLADLHAELIAPLEGRLGSSALIVVPDRQLHRIPFHALQRHGRSLADDHVILVAPTADVFHMSREKRAAAGGADLIVGGPGATEAELEPLAAALPGSRVLTGSEATIANLRRHAEGARRLHLTARAAFRQDNPMFSTLHLADGHLSLFDLYGLRLGSELVTLSGCAPELDGHFGTDAWVGLARGLLYAGARSVLLPLWNAPPEGSARLLAAFYRRLEEGSDRARALRDAMLEERRRQPHPLIWGSFALVGSPD